MSSPETILYAGYGANRDPRMIEEITGRVPKVLGAIAILDVELCVQRFNQIPGEVAKNAPAPLSPKQIMEDSWGEDSDFEVYTLRYKDGSRVAATLYELSPEERALIANWEMIEFDWYERMQVTVELEDKTLATAETEGLRSPQEVDRAIDGMDYETYLNDPEAMYSVARKARQEYEEL